jgi:hypothetical protein
MAQEQIGQRSTKATAHCPIAASPSEGYNINDSFAQIEVDAKTRALAYEVLWLQLRAMSEWPLGLIHPLCWTFCYLL